MKFIRMQTKKNLLISKKFDKKLFLYTKKQLTKIKNYTNLYEFKAYFD